MEPPGARISCDLAEDGYPKNASGQETGRQDQIELERGISNANRKSSGFFSWIISGEGEKDGIAR